MTARAFCVLRSGGDYDASDVAALKVGIERHLPGYELNCLSDVDVPCRRIPLKYDWPGWWAKMELFREDIHGDIFYVDLDTVIVNDILELVEVQALDTMLSDFYHPFRPASGLMYITEASKAEVWRAWVTSPHRHMNMFRGGDQQFLENQTFGRKARRWQTEFPNQVISFKAHLRPRPPRGGPQLNVPPKFAKIVCFHGKPRPKNVRESWVVAARTAA